MKKLLLSLITLIAGMSPAWAADPADLQVLVNTDFSVFTDGSEEKPVSLYSYQFTGKVEGYSGVSGISAAGGKILVGPSGYLQLSYLSGMPTGGGTVRITAEVKMLDSYGGCIQYQPSYSTSSYVDEMVTSNDWTTVTSMVGSVTSTSKIKITPFLSVSGFYIKSLKVEYSADFIASPEAYLPTDANGTSFTASCSVITGASSYEADVFSLDANDEIIYFSRDVELKKASAYSTYASAKITDLDPATTYYYVARAVTSAGKKSENSEPVKVIISKTSMPAPEALSATNVTENGFTANWDAVEDAVGYIVNTYEKIITTESSDISIFAEDFSGVNVGSESSLEYSGDLNNYTKVPGWITDLSKTFAAGYFVIYPSGSEGVLITPSIDLAQSNGAFEVVLTAATRSYSGFEASDDTVTIEIIDNDDEVVETAAVATMNKKGMSEYKFSFTKGSADTRLRITFTKADGSTMKLFVDAIDVIQTLPAGSVIERLVSSTSSTATSADVKLTPEEGVEYSYAVIAVGETVVGSGANAAVGTIESDLSNKVVVDFKSAGIDNVIENVTAPAAWKAADGVLGVNGSNVAVYDLTGRNLYRTVLPAGINTLDLNIRGLVIVTVDGKSCKIIL